MKTYAILLRGVTPSGRNKVPMAALRTALASAGLLDVQTYIQSGNVVAKTEAGRESLRSLVHEVIAREIGAEIAVIVRTHRELRSVLAGNPFPPNAASRTYFSLLASPPAPSLVEDFRRLSASPDEVEVVGSTVYTLYATKHSDSKFNNNFFERRLKVVATTRNFNTMSRLVELTA
jgi:uncharacterized protein (DUF1697 family)